MEKYRTLMPRFGALLLDTILLLPLSIIGELIKNAEFSPNVKLTLLFLASLAGTVYFIVMHTLFGQTVGKMLMKVKVLDATEAPLKFYQAILRDLPQLFFLVGSFVFMNPLAAGEIDPNSPEYFQNPLMILMMLWGFSDILSPFTNEKRRALHDYIAKTVVVRVES